MTILLEDLKNYINEKDWDAASNGFKHHSNLIDKLTWKEFDSLWSHAPVAVVNELLKVSPEVYSQEGLSGTLPQTKMKSKEWDSLSSIFQEFPNIAAATDVKEAIRRGASIEFLNRHWEEVPTLVVSIYGKDWNKVAEIFKNEPHLAQELLTNDEFHVIWGDAPVETVRELLLSWPESYKNTGPFGGTLPGYKIRREEWEFLETILEEFPNIVTVEDVKDACQFNAKYEIFEMMIDQRPSALLEEPDHIFGLIETDQVKHFCAVLKRCPAAADVTHTTLNLSPLLVVLQRESRTNAEWIGAILEASPNAAQVKDYDGKLPLHLAYQLGASPEIINMLLQAFPEGDKSRDNLGRTPRELSDQSGQDVFRPASEALLLVGHGKEGGQRKKINIEAQPDGAVVLCRGDVLLRDLRPGQTEEEKFVYSDYSKQVLTRHSIFATLLDEFSKLVGIDDKHVIQMAAAIQALAVQYLSNQDDTIIDFALLGNPGYWYQQEVLKLVMRVFHEGQSNITQNNPSIVDDASMCLEHLEGRRNGEESLQPSFLHAKAFTDVTNWLTEGFESDKLSFQGPVLKPLQSLFNKLFIRRGQTNAHVIGDYVRASLLVDEVDMLRTIVSKIKTAFPNITENQFKHPDTFGELDGFLTYVHEDLQYVPGSTLALPYRFKKNGSQKKKKEPMWYNFNFFLQLPEYHKVGQSEMFVACELQIGLTEEVNSHRVSHVAYERDRILLAQPLLKNYDSAMKKKTEGGATDHDGSTLAMSNCSEDDGRLIEKVLFGQIATEVLLSPTTEREDKNTNLLSYECGPFALSNDQVMIGSFTKTERLCINNRCFNFFASPMSGSRNNAVVVAGPYKLHAGTNQQRRYFVEQFNLMGVQGCFSLISPGCLDVTVGLYAHVGPYLIQIACSSRIVESEVEVEETMMTIVESNQNNTYLERVCPIPAGATALEVIVHGIFMEEFKFEKLELSLKEFNVQ